jgi:hypothetical protein
MLMTNGTQLQAEPIKEKNISGTVGLDRSILNKSCGWGV